VATPSAAQTAAVTPTAAQTSDSQAAGLEEVVVTAERRTERLEDVPVSVTVLSGTQLKDRQLKNVNDLSLATPSMTTAVAFSPLDIRINLRGISELVPSLAVDPATGIYIDGVYWATDAGSNLGLVDMERVEVLKGPQGTLFGRNTLGGALNLTTKGPDPDFGGDASATVGNLGTYGFTGVLNLPINDNGGLRFVYDHEQTAGYGSDLLLGRRLNSLKSDYMRISGKYKITNNIDFEGMAYYTTGEAGPIAAKITYADPNNPLTTLIPALQGKPGESLADYVGKGGFYDTFANFYRASNPFTIYGTADTINATFGAIHARSITGYTHTYDNPGFDTDGTPFTVLNVDQWPLKASQFSEELDLFDDDAMDNRLTWIGGLYYFNETGSQLVYSEQIPPIGTQFGQYNVDGPIVDNSSYAAFGQATYEILPKLQLTGGVRYTYDERAVTYVPSYYSLADNSYLSCGLASAPHNIPQSQCHQSYSTSFGYVPWTAGLNYKASDDTLLYAKVSEGYRSGAWSQTAPTTASLSVFAPVAPESILTPEVGAKLELWDGHLRINGAAYYADYSNIQVNNNILNPQGQPVTIIQNAGTGEVYGGELEASALIGRLRVDTGLGLVEPHYTSGPYSVQGQQQPFFNVSKTTANVALSYPLNTGFGVLTTSGSYSWRSKVVYGNLQPGNAAQNASITQGAYGLLDAKMELNVNNSNWTVSIWGKNVAGQKYYAGGVQYYQSLGYTEMVPGQPATFGATLSVDF
jgi:iron complex outermembrane receptor protein